MRALIVDDNKLNQWVLFSYVSPFCSVDTADSGEEALEKFAAARESGAPYGLVYLDFFMPGITGAETGKAMRAMERDTQGDTASSVFCVISGSPEANTEFRYALGNDPDVYYAPKPWKKDDILYALCQGASTWLEPYSV